MQVFLNPRKLVPCTKINESTIYINCDLVLPDNDTEVQREYLSSSFPYQNPKPKIYDRHSKSSLRICCITQLVKSLTMKIVLL